MLHDYFSFEEKFAKTWLLSPEVSKLHHVRRVLGELEGVTMPGDVQAQEFLLPQREVRSFVRGKFAKGVGILWITKGNSNYYKN